MFLFSRMYPKMNLLEGGDGGGGAGNPGANASTNNNDGANSNGGATNGSTGGITWDAIKATLPDDLKNEGALGPIKDVQTLVKNYLHAQKMIGKQSIPIPDAKHATQDDYVQIMRKLGAPEKLEDFKVRLPDGVKEEAMDPTFLSAIKEVAVKSGVLPWQFEQIFGAYHKYADEKIKQSDADFKRQEAEDKNSLKVAWGAAFDTQVKRANAALKELLPDQADRNRLIEDGLGSHPAVLKMLAASAKYFKEDVFLGQGEGGLAGITPQDAIKKAREIQGDARHPYRNPTHPNHAAAKKEVQDLYRLAYPE